MSFGCQDLGFAARCSREPELKQESFPDLAPCPIWLVPPAFRVARLADLCTAAGRESATPEEAEQLLQQLGINYAPKIILTGPWNGPVATWANKENGGYLVLWQHGGPLHTRGSSENA